MKAAVPAGRPGVCVGSRQLETELKREAEDGDAALGGTHSEALVHTTGVSPTTSREPGESKEPRAAQGWPEMQEPGQQIEKEQNGEEAVQL